MQGRARPLTLVVITHQTNPMIFVSAGEASGDEYGAQAIAALRGLLPDATFTGLGGRQMEAAGQVRVVRAEDVAHMGITEVLRHMPRVYREYRRLVRSIRRQRPDVAILIDFPDVNFRLARHLKQLGVPVVWFVSPQLWAWKRSRLRWVQQRVDKMLVIFPFEESFYRARGVDAEFVAHPLAELAPPSISREQYAERYGLEVARTWIALLPGSRVKEIRANLATMLDAACLLRELHDAGPALHFLIPVASTIDRGWLLEQAGIWAKGSDRGARLLANLTLVPEAREALFHARAGVVASGTATVQAAVIGTPFVVVYRVSRLTFRLARRLVRYPGEVVAELDAFGNLPIAMVNLIAGRRVAPELLQGQFTAEAVAEAVRGLLPDGSTRTAAIAGLEEVRQKLKVGHGAEGSMQRLGAAVLGALGSK